MKNVKLLAFLLVTVFVVSANFARHPRPCAMLSCGAMCHPMFLDEETQAKNEFRSALAACEGDQVCRDEARDAHDQRMQEINDKRDEFKQQYKTCLHDLHRGENHEECCPVIQQKLDETGSAAPIAMDECKL